MAEYLSASIPFSFLINYSASLASLLNISSSCFRYLTSCYLLSLSWRVYLFIWSSIFAYFASVCSDYFLCKSVILFSLRSSSAMMAALFLNSMQSLSKKTIFFFNYSFTFSIFFCLSSLRSSSSFFSRNWESSSWIFYFIFFWTASPAWTFSSNYSFYFLKI